MFYSAFTAYSQSTVRRTPPSRTRAATDTVRSRFPVSKTAIESYDDLNQNTPADLRTPKNVVSEIRYDEHTNSYLFVTTVGGKEVITPFKLSSNEYNAYSQRKDRQKYFKEKNDEFFAKGKQEFDFLDMKFNIGPLDKVFGKGGVQIKTQGSAELVFGVKTNHIGNPSLSQSARRRSYFDFEEKIQANVSAKVGEKLNFTLNYNTDATFDFDSKKLKLQYEGTEDEIIKNIEAGNVSLTTGSSLIRGGSALFGIKTTLQFGKLTVSALLSQQESQSQTVNMAGGVQTTPFEFSAEKYDENRHFFLGHFFRNTYDQSTSKLPLVTSGVSINRVEIWVTNKRGNFTQARNIVAFMDMAENEKESASKLFPPYAPQANPSNGSNGLYQSLKTDFPRNITLVPSSYRGINGGDEYVKIESARLLDASEYILNKELGYISLRNTLYADEVLAVSFEYTYNGRIYQVGEFANDVTDTNQSLFVKMLKGTIINTKKPTWRLMMKNVYSLNAFQVQREKFRLDVKYLSDTTGILLNYLPIQEFKDQPLIRLLNLDRLDKNNEPHPDGFYDFIEGYTILPSMGKVVFPVVEPFGSYLRGKLEERVPKAVADKYVFQELYDETLSVARQLSDKNKYVIKGEYKSSGGNEIRLGAMNVPRGSVVVTAGGVTLQENSDYSVDYSMGTVTILNQSIIESGTPISVQLENRSLMSMQRKTMMGLDLNYAFSKNFNIGATVMNLTEKPLTEKLGVGQEVINNTLWGFNTAYNTEFQFLTSWIDMLPFINASAPSRLSIKAEFAQLIPSLTRSDKESGASYIDDFEAAQLGIDIRNPYSWALASTPSTFEESKWSNDIRYGKNRARLAWFYIDRMFTDKNSNLTPTHLKNDLEQLSNHWVREIEAQEVFPNREIAYGQSSKLQVLNLSFYPEERGPYNILSSELLPNGRLSNPTQRWGGMMRKMDNTDFESANIEYLQFWMMDPFVNGKEDGGELFFNFGEISEDILKDGMKSFENGLPAEGNTATVTDQVWGKIPERQSMVYAFDNATGARIKQDVGFNGINDQEEKGYGAYAVYFNNVLNLVDPTTRETMLADKMSPLNDPAGDDYHFYRGNDWDQQQAPILLRYKYYNGVEGNSLSPEEAGDPQYQASRTVPDVEDINQDNTLNEYENYFEYKVSLNKAQMMVGQNYITDKRTTTVRLANGQETSVSWYQFKVPLREGVKRGSIQDFKTIRFARLYLNGFQRETHLRFATMELVRGEWRNYNLPLNISSYTDAGKLDVSVVNIEENAGQEPVNYVLPPGVTRVIDPAQAQIMQLNEQAMVLKVSDLAINDSRAVYKNTSFDMRLFKRIRMFTHAEKFIDDPQEIARGDFEIFMRLGSDQRNNYYEYAIPLSVTAPGRYNTYNTRDQEAVWPSNNAFDFPLSLLTDLKLQRNATGRTEMRDPENQNNSVSIKGNPTLSEVRTILVGVRRKSPAVKGDIIVWVNELRLTDFNQDGGWAAMASANLSVSDLATVNVGGRVETVGFGGIDQSLMQRRLDDFYQYDISTSIDLGRLLPAKAKVSVPLSYAVSEQRSLPKYNPIDQDILLTDALKNTKTEQEKDSINTFAIDKVAYESFSVSGVKVDIKSKTPMPYDPANFTIGYTYNKQSKQNPTTVFENTVDYRGNLAYNYSPFIVPWTPFKKIKNTSPYLKILKDLSINYLPSSIQFATNVSRYYYEQKLRDFDSGTFGDVMPTSVSKNFLWDRQFAMQWSPLRTLSLSINTGTNARIYEPAGEVNRRLHPDEYEAWRDTVWQSVQELGTPWTYQQTFNASYDLPTKSIPFLDWTTIGAKYNATYGWSRGAYIDATTVLGNNINNQGQFNGEVRLNFEGLYNKSKYLKETNARFASGRRTGAAKNTSSKKETKKPVTVVEREVLLRQDTTYNISHNFDNRNLKVVAVRNADNKHYPVRYKVLDRNTIRIESRDTVGIKVMIQQGPRPEEEPLYKVAQGGVRFLMLVRNVNIRYRQGRTTMLPSFLPNVGSVFGQGSVGGMLQPGLDFAFGFTDEEYVYRAQHNGWLISDTSRVSPAVITHSRELQIDATLEPFKAFKITLNVAYNSTENNQVQFMYAGMPTLRGGSFTMTHNTMLTSLSTAKVEDGYTSKAFDQFLSNRGVVKQRLEEQYNRLAYPGGGAYRPGSVNPASSDVLIPAFIAAYTGGSVDKVKLTPFPSMGSLLPNWSITYDGLSQIDFLKRYVRSITLKHGYRCTYSVGTYASYLNWMEVNDGFGFIVGETTGQYVPSSQYNIPSVSFVESYSPLIGLDVTLLNGISVRGEYKDSRNVALNIGAGQIVESLSHDVTVGLGYKIANFNTILKIKNSQKGFNNDLSLRADFSFRHNMALIRRIEEAYTQATSGANSVVIKFSADYTLSKFITLRAFYDNQINTPLVSSSAYPITNTNVGVAIRLSLTR